MSSYYNQQYAPSAQYAQPQPGAQHGVQMQQFSGQAAVYGGVGVAPPSQLMKKRSSGKLFGSAGSRLDAKNLDLPCPQITTDSDVSLLLKSMHVHMEVFVSTAFVTMHGVWINTLPNPVNTTFRLPQTSNSTVTEVQVYIGNRLLETQIISNEDAMSFQKEQTNAEMKKYEKYNPNQFQLPIMNVNPGEEVNLQVKYFDNLVFYAGSYVAKVPLTFDPNALAGPVETVLSITCNISSGTPNCEWGSSSHHMNAKNQSQSFIQLEAAKDGRQWQNQDFVISYMVKSNNILGACLTEAANPELGDKRDSFAVFVSPPQIGSLQQWFGRSFFFMLDRSGSMTGTPWSEAQNAVAFCLDRLVPGDIFNIVAFDHEQAYFSPQTMLEANPANIGNAKNWVYQMRPRGTTDILTPVQVVTQLQRQVVGKIPYVMLITDGAVKNERQICAHIKKTAGPVRFYTLGIGPYCNAYFLKMVALIGRGFSDVALATHKVRQQIVHLFNLCSAPVLTDVQILINGVKGVELYPYPIPDLFCGNPIVVGGKYMGTFPRSITIRGITPTGQVSNIEVPVGCMPHIPVEKTFVKNRLDLLTAQGWLTADDKIRKQVVSISIAHQMPCVHTTMVAYETTEEGKAKAKSKKKKAALVAGGVVGVGALVAAGAIVGVGGIVVVGVVAANFGDISATLANSSVKNALGNLATVGFEGVSSQMILAGGTIANGLADAGSAMVDGASDVAPMILDGATAAAGGLTSGVATIASGGASAVGTTASAVMDFASPPDIIPDVDSSACNCCSSCNLPDGLGEQCEGCFGNISKFITNLLDQ